MLITDARESAAAEFDRRRRRYAVMMSARALCVIGAALVYQISLWLALAFIVGGAVLPWCAVLIANDRPAKKRTSRAPRGSAPPAPALPAGEESKTIEG